MYEFTTGQNLGSEKFTSSNACVVTVIFLHGKNISLFLNVFNKRIMIQHLFFELHCTDIVVCIYFGSLPLKRQSENGTGVLEAALDSLLFM